MLYKLEDNKLVANPSFLHVGDTLYHPVNNDVLMINGWKTKKTIDQPAIEWCEQLIPTYTENETEIIEDWVIHPLSNLRDVYLDRILIEMNRALENDFTWAGKVVKFSESNQKDYLASFAVATYQPALFIPMEYTFKNNVKHMMETLDELVLFTNKGLQFVSRCLENYRTEKDNVMAMDDAQLYQYLKS